METSMGPLPFHRTRLWGLFAATTIFVCISYAQSPVSGRCAVTAVPPQARGEGITERMGDILLQCTGSNPGSVLAGNLECVGECYLTIAPRNRPKARTTPRRHLSNRISSGDEACSLQNKVDHRYLPESLAGAGIEPATRGFSVHCSAN